MLVACRLAGLSALDTYCAGVKGRAQCAAGGWTIGLWNRAFRRFAPFAAPPTNGSFLRILLKKPIL